MSTFKIKTERRDDGRGFAGVNVLVRMVGDYQRRAIGGWYANETGRKVFGGPMEKGPHAYAYGVCTVISNPPQKDNREVIDVTLGDVLVIAGHRYEVTTNWTKKDIILKLVK